MGEPATDLVQGELDATDGAAVDGRRAAAEVRRLEDARARHAAAGHRPPDDDEELVLYLERDQFVAGTSLPVPPAQLGPRTQLALWALRVFVIVLAVMVIVTFVAALR